MHPTICQVGPFTVYSYGLMLVVAFTVSSLLAARQARVENVNPDIIFNLCFNVFIWGVIGARIFYILDNLKFYLKNPVEIIMLQHGGLAWYGGLGLASIAGYIYLRKKRLPIYKILDLIIPFVALAQSIGRIGCLLNGCCFGIASKFGLYFASHDAILIPTQIYSSLILLLIFIVLRLLQARPHPPGNILFTYLVLYPFKRFFIEFWRQDNPHIFLGLTLFQFISLAVFALSIFKLSKNARV